MRCGVPEKQPRELHHIPIYDKANNYNDKPAEEKQVEEVELRDQYGDGD